MTQHLPMKPARLLTPTDFGLIPMLLAFVNIGQILANAGFGTALVQRQGSNGDAGQMVAAALGTAAH